MVPDRHTGYGLKPLDLGLVLERDRVNLDGIVNVIEYKRVVDCAPYPARPAPAAQVGDYQPGRVSPLEAGMRLRIAAADDDNHLFEPFGNPVAAKGPVGHIPPTTKGFGCFG